VSNDEEPGNVASFFLSGSVRATPPPITHALISPCRTLSQATMNHSCSSALHGSYQAYGSSAVCSKEDIQSLVQPMGPSVLPSVMFILAPVPLPPGSVVVSANNESGALDPVSQHLSAQNLLFQNFDGALYQPSPVHANNLCVLQHASTVLPQHVVPPSPFTFAQGRVALQHENAVMKSIPFPCGSAGPTPWPNQFEVNGSLLSFPQLCHVNRTVDPSQPTGKTFNARQASPAKVASNTPTKRPTRVKVCKGTPDLQPSNQMTKRIRICGSWIRVPKQVRKTTDDKRGS
jgi:hypothetical protein